MVDMMKVLETLHAENARLRDALDKWVEWEAKMINTREVWNLGLPHMTQEIYDDYCELQMIRNEALKVCVDAMSDETLVRDGAENMYYELNRYAFQYEEPDKEKALQIIERFLDAYNTHGKLSSDARLRDALGEFAKPGHWLEDDYDGHWVWNGEQNDPHFFAQEALKEI